MKKTTLSEGSTHAPWQREFYKNVDTFTELGLSSSKARELLQGFLELSTNAPLPDVLDSFRDESALDRVGVYTERKDDIRDFMVEFFKPLLSRFKLIGKDNIEKIATLRGKFPLTLVANHLSHFDTAALYVLLYLSGGKARDLANSMVFIAGRLVFTPDFTRTALYMINSLLVCSKRDMAENPSLGDMMTRINMRSFRQAQSLQKTGQIIAVFPEGTRSRTGQLLTFVDTVYHYVANKVIIPVSLVNTDKILPTDSFLFRPTSGQIVVGNPFLVGKLSSAKMKELPKFVQKLEVPDDVNRKQYIIDSLAMYIGRNLHKNRHGNYRNLYKSKRGLKDENILIEKPKKAKEKVVVIGHTSHGTAIASILSNKDVEINIFILSKDKAHQFNESRIDEDNFPLYKLPPNITFTNNRDDIADGTIFIQAARAWEVKEYYNKIRYPLIETNGPIINIVKGFTGSKYGLISDDLQKLYGIDPVRLVAVAGANYPEQIMERKFTGFELAAINTSLVNRLVELFNTGYVSCRPAINPYDIRGVQIGGALKNIYALGIGLLDGYYEKNLGGNSDNSLFHFSSQIFQEMVSIGVRLGGKESTFNGLSGLTDLMLSCFGQDARDRQFGHDFIFEQADEKLKMPGIFALKALPDLLNLSNKSHPLVMAIYSILIKHKNPEPILEQIVNNFQSSQMMI